MRWAILFVPLFSVCLPFSAYAAPGDEDYTIGKKAYMEKRYTEAFHHLSKAAEANHGEAMLWLGSMYGDKKFGLKRDFAKVQEWYEKAAENGSAEAAYRIANTRAFIIWDDEDYSETIPLFERAANLGHSRAQYWLADVYRSSQKKHANEKKRIYWMKKAAEGGEKNAQFALAEIYLQGAGVPRDEQKAFEWLETSAHHGNAKAQAQLGRVLFNGLLGQNANSRIGRSWIAIAAQNGLPEAYAMLGMLFLTGETVEKNPDKAYALMVEAARKGDKGVIFKIGEIFALGGFGKRDIINALTWIHIAELKDDPRAKDAKKVIKQKFGYTTEDMRKATVRANNCMATNFKSCEYDTKELPNFSQQLYEGVLESLKKDKK